MLAHERGKSKNPQDKIGLAFYDIPCIIEPPMKNMFLIALSMFLELLLLFDLEV